MAFRSHSCKVPHEATIQHVGAKRDIHRTPGSRNGALAHEPLRYPWLSRPSARNRLCGDVAPLLRRAQCADNNLVAHSAQCTFQDPRLLFAHEALQRQLAQVSCYGDTFVADLSLATAQIGTVSPQARPNEVLDWVNMCSKLVMHLSSPASTQSAMSATLRCPCMYSVGKKRYGTSILRP